MRILKWAMIAGIIASPVHAKSNLSRAGEEALRTMAHDPDSFCRLSASASILTSGGVEVSKISDGVAGHYAESGLLLEARRLVEANKETETGSSPLLRHMDRVRNDSSLADRAEAERKHRAEVLGLSYSPPRTMPSTGLSGTKANRFDQQTQILFCQSEATIGDALWAVVTWQVGFRDPASDAYHASLGWYVRNVEAPDAAVEFATANPEKVMVVFNKNLRLPFSQARTKVENDAANLAHRQASRAAEQKRIADFASSPAGRAEAARRRAQEAARNRALSAEYRRLGLACQNHGGTWGVKWSATTIVPVTPGEVPTELARISIGCYHL